MESLAFVTVVQGAAHASLALYSGIITAIVAACALAVFYFEKRAGKPPVVGTRMTRLAVVYACIVSTAATPTDYLFEAVAGYYILVRPCRAVFPVHALTLRPRSSPSARCPPRSGPNKSR